jgi:hypothetical protein
MMATSPACAMTFIQHPAFQSLVLPLLLAAVAMALLRTAGPRWTSLGAGLGLVVAMAFWPGFDWPASSRAQTAPWVAAAGLVLAALATALNAPGTRACSRRVGLLITALITLLAVSLAVWSALGGSLLLAQLALMAGSVCGVCLLWAWRSACITPVSLLPLVLAGLTIAHAQFSVASPAPGTGGDSAESDDPYYVPKLK